MDEKQILTMIANNHLKPSVIDRVSENVVFYGFPLPSCKGFDDPKWLIQIYYVDGSMEFTGYPYGRREFIYAWTEREDLPYSINENMEPFYFNFQPPV